MRPQQRIFLRLWPQTKQTHVQTPELRIWYAQADVRAALFLPQFTTDAATGKMRADVHLVEIAKALAARLEVELVLVGYPTPPKAMEGLKEDACDVAFLGINPSRALMSVSRPVR